MELFKRIAFVCLALNALIDLTLAVITYHQSGILVVSIFLMAICGIFSFPLYFALSNEEFHWRSFRRAGPIDMWGNPVAYWFTFAVLALFHLFITVQMAVAVHQTMTTVPKTPITFRGRVSSPMRNRHL